MWNSKTNSSRIISVGVSAAKSCSKNTEKDEIWNKRAKAQVTQELPVKAKHLLKKFSKDLLVCEKHK